MIPVQQRILICLISIGLPTATMHLSDAGTLDAKQLSFYHTHTKEKLDIVYFENGEYVGSALMEINRYLGDFRTGDTTVMDPGLLDLIYDIRATLGSHGTYEVISAYRSPKTNEMLRKTGAGNPYQSILRQAIHSLLGRQSRVVEAALQ